MEEDFTQSRKDAKNIDIRPYFIFPQLHDL